jgi:HD superfamily phosphohydrolase YqeK
VAYVLTLERHLDIPKGTVYAAALVHDLGRYDEYYHGVPHHTAHGRASSVLKACGYSDGEVASILDAVSHHREPSDGLNSLADVLSRADKLSRPCYYCDASDECYWSDSKKNHTLLV